MKLSDSPTTTVMLVDDHEIVREGLQEVLERTGEFRVVGQASDGEDALEVALRERPDVIVMDLLMPRKNGVDACREITDRLPDARILVLTVSSESDAVIDALAAGATGYLQKVCGRREFLDAMRDVAAGEYRIPGDALRRVLANIRSTPRATGGPSLADITPREQELLALFVRGRTYAEIGESRGIRPLSARNAIYNIQRKLGFGNKQELTVWAVQNGLLTSEDD